MADTHQLHDEWYEIWFGPEDARRHVKRMDESSMLDEVNQLHETRRLNLDSAENNPDVKWREPSRALAEAVANVEVIKISVDREPVDVPEPTAVDGPPPTAADAPVHAEVKAPVAQAASDSKD
jgi:hypothetical protein